jgi:tetratricopeptide (TPR) repeat protein
LPVLELDPTNANAYFNRGSTFDSLGQYDRAIADYTRALELDREMAATDGVTAAAAEKAIANATKAAGLSAR